MPTILELLEQKQGTTPSIPSPVNTSSGDDTSKTLIEIYKNKDSFKYGTNYSLVKPDNETLVEQETSGIRISSLVEINNPLIYGNEATRITLRSTPDLEIMKKGANGSDGGSGLIGKGLSKLTGGAITSIGDIRDKVNGVLGIPVNLIPTRVSDKIIELRAQNKTSADPITKDFYGKNGTGLGKFLKDSGGGNLKTIGKQALGNGINLLKDKARTALFGGGQSIGEALGDKPVKEYSNKVTYSDTKKDTSLPGVEQDYKKDGGSAKEFKGIDLTKVSPIHGVKRESGRDKLAGLFGNSEYGFDSKIANPNISYSPKDGENYSKIFKDAEGRSKTLVERGITNGSDTIMMGDPYTTTVDTDSGEVTVEGFAAVRDLVPLFIGRHNSTTYPMMAFRCNITGLTETSSPSWASNNFVGNPYKYYIFETVERSVSFNLQVYCQNPLELANNWSKLSNLTKLSYPLIENNMAHPNFVEFTLGDMYKNKVCIMDSLSYTIPDNGTWETDVEGLILPKFVDVAITLKFVENVEDGSIRGLYSYPKNGDGVTSQHEIYSTPNNIEYYVNDENGNLKKSNKGDYIDQLSTGKRRVIKIKTN